MMSEQDHFYGEMHFRGMLNDSEWHFKTMVSPEEQGLSKQDVEWGNSREPLPFDRFKRDVYNLATSLFYSHVSDSDYGTPEEQLWDDYGTLVSSAPVFQGQTRAERSNTSTQRYERLFRTNFDRYIPGAHPGTLGSCDAEDGYVAPARLRSVLLRLLDPDPQKRPTAQEAAQELREIRDQ